MLQVKYIQFSPDVENRMLKNKFNMNLPALVRFSQQDVYMSLTILGCTVKCRFRFTDCPLIHCVNGHGSHLGHVTSIMLMNFHFLVPKSLHTNFG